MALPPPEPNDEEKEEKLPQDFSTPFSPPDDTQAAQFPTDNSQQSSDDQQFTTIDPTHPATDTNIEEEELYDEGLSGAAEAGEPNSQDTVIGYHKDHRSDDTANNTKQQ